MPGLPLNCNPPYLCLLIARIAGIIHQHPVDTCLTESGYFTWHEDPQFYPFSLKQHDFIRNGWMISYHVHMLHFLFSRAKCFFSGVFEYFFICRIMPENRNKFGLFSLGLFLFLFYFLTTDLVKTSSTVLNRSGRSG
jgi:hypothetical protein